MDFTDIVQGKIEALRAGRGPRAVAEAAKVERFRIKVAPLIAAVEGMTARLSKDAMFSAAFGQSDIMLEPRGEPTCLAGLIKKTGPAGSIVFVLSEYQHVLFHIDPSLTVLDALKCNDLRYPQANSITGNMTGLDAIIQRAEDHIADFLADVALSPAARLLEPPSLAERGFGS